jgi:hypothetical protein
MKTKHTLFGLLLTVPLLLTGISTAADDEQPTATLTIDETQVMLIIGGSVGGGVLVFGDKSYAFKTSGLKLGGVGVHKIHLRGDVYGLTDIEDFAGTYFEAQAGITVGKGKGGLFLSHDDVTIHLKANADGLALSMGVGGFKITMK